MVKATVGPCQERQIGARVLGKILKSLPTKVNQNSGRTFRLGKATLGTIEVVVANGEEA